MRPTVYFHIDELSRDSVVASALKKYLKSRRIRLVYGSRRLTSFFSRFRSPFDLHIFPCIDMFAQFYNNIPTDSVIILPSESCSSGENTFNRLAQHLLGADSTTSWEHPAHSCVKKFLLWGTGHKRAIVSKLPHLSHKLLVVGHPRFDSRCLPQRGTRNMVQTNVGLVTRFDWINPFNRLNLLASVFGSRKQRGDALKYWESDGYNIEDIWYTQILDLRLLFDIIDLFRSELPSNFNLSLRVHPREDFSAWRSLLDILPGNVEVELCEHSQPFAHWASTQDVLISPPSTSCYDAALLGKPFINTINLSEESRRLHSLPKSDDSDPIFNHFAAPRSFEELKSILISIKGSQYLPMSNELSILLEDQVGYPAQASSLSQVADVVEGLLASRRVGSKIFRYLIFAMYKIYDCFRFLIFAEVHTSSNFVMTPKRIHAIDSLSS